MRHQQLTCNLLIRELVLELMSIEVEFGDHFIDLFNVSLKAFLRLLYAFVPKHGVETFDVLLCYQDI